jgi:hypothetical protein
MSARFSLTRIASTAACSLIVASCSGSIGAGSGGFDYECPEGASLVQVSLIDLSKGGLDEALIGERLDSIQVDAERTADCDGSLVVVSWAGSSASAEVLFDGPVPVAGATEIGKDRKIPGAVTKVMEEVRANLNGAIETSGQQGGDLVGAFTVIADVVGREGGDDRAVWVNVYTDGVSTSGDAPVNDPNLSQSDVDSLVAAQNMPGLEGVTIALRGIGRVAGSVQPPQDYIDLVQTYAMGLCEATGAACSVSTSAVSS